MNERYTRPTVAFDVDGTLLSQSGPREDIINILRLLVPWCQVIVWSGGGLHYAKQRGRELGLPPGVKYQAKQGPRTVDVAFDDEHVKLGLVNIRVGEES